MLNKDEENFLIQFLTKDSVVLEYGSGGTTVAFGCDAKEWHSIEHDETWFNKVKESLISPKKTPRKYENVHCHFAKNTPLSPKERKRAVAEWGEPIVVDGIEKEFKDYIDMVDKIGVEKYDIVLIDGRARTFCLKKILPYLKETSFVYVHDWQRPEYKTSEYLRHYTNKIVLQSPTRLNAPNKREVDGGDIKEMVRLSPRFRRKWNPMRFCTEFTIYE